MTEKEAVDELKMDNERCRMQCENSCSGIDNNQCNCEDGIIEKMIDELLAYREIGTINDCQQSMQLINAAEREGLSKIIDEWILYHKIGTVEEVQAAADKQKAKIPYYEGDGYDDDGNIIYDTWICPNCGEHYEVDYDDYAYCPKCGQEIDWRKDE